MAAGDCGGQTYMEVDPKIALSYPVLADQQSQGYADPAFKYAYNLLNEKLAVDLEGDSASIDAIFAIAQLYKTPPAAATLTSISPTTRLHGTGDFTMTFTGTNVATGLTVIFGTVTEPRVTVVNSTTATCIIYNAYYPSAGSITVKVQNGGGTAASAGQTFTVT